MIKILIVEDHAMLRESLEHIIGEQGDMQVVGTLDNAAEAPELCCTLKPDLVLMDVVMDNSACGIVIAKQIREKIPDIKIVIMTSLPEITFIDEARKAGAHSYIYKNSGNEHLFYTIRNTMRGNSIYPGLDNKSPFACQFTGKEIAVIRLVCQGLSRDEMAKELGITEAMLRPLITSILNKTGFDNIMKFAVYATSRGLVVPLND